MSLMRLRNSVLLGLLGLMAASCASSGPGREQAPLDPQQWRGERSAEASPEVVTPPSQANWTLLCHEFRGPNHVALAKRTRDQLAESTGLPDWYVVHGEEQSTLFYGFYRSFNDTADRRESERAQRDRRQISSMTDQMGNQPFPHAIFVALDTPSADGPPEWNLANVDGFWSVQVAAYHGSAQRKQFAVEAVRAAREMGIEAYYYHGDSVSSVCIGVWPREAVREQESAVAQSPNPTQDIFVTTEVIPNMPQDIRGTDGQPVKVMAPRIEIQDPTLLQVLRDFPAHAVNGEEIVRIRPDPETGRPREVREPSFLIQIPRGEPSVLSGTTRMADQGAADAWQQPDEQYVPVERPALSPRQTPGGRLRSLD